MIDSISNIIITLIKLHDISKELPGDIKTKGDLIYIATHYLKLPPLEQMFAIDYTYASHTTYKRLRDELPTKQKKESQVEHFLDLSRLIYQKKTTFTFHNIIYSSPEFIGFADGILGKFPNPTRLKNKRIETYEENDMIDHFLKIFTDTTNLKDKQKIYIEEYEETININTNDFYCDLYFLAYNRGQIYKHKSNEVTNKITYLGREDGKIMIKTFDGTIKKLDRIKYQQPHIINKQ